MLLFLADLFVCVPFHALCERPGEHTILICRRICLFTDPHRMDDTTNVFSMALTPRREAVPIIDPRIGVFGKFWIDRKEILSTRGLERMNNRNGTHPLSMCLLFQKRRCIAGERCNQAHVKHAYADRLWVAIQTILPTAMTCVCCKEHGGDPTHRSAYILQYFDRMAQWIITITSPEQASACCVHSIGQAAA